MYFTYDYHYPRIIMSYFTQEETEPLPYERLIFF